MTGRPILAIHSGAPEPSSSFVDVEDLDPDVIASLRAHPQADHLLQSVLRVRVIGEEPPEGDELPDVLGRCQTRESGLRFIPHFPFESGVRYCARFDPRPLNRPDLAEVLRLEFSLPSRPRPAPAHVEHIFPSSDSLPENLLRFYVVFSGSMRRGLAEREIALLGQDGQPVSDALYRPPVELWDGSMRQLTVLLDPGRIKRWVGPNRELGPPLKVGMEYTLFIGSGMVDSFGHRLRETYCKTFRVTEPVREPIVVERWKVLPPSAKSYQPLALTFPRPLDWALLWHKISITSKRGMAIPGWIAIDKRERRWSFTPASPWAAGSYHVRIASGLEDTCGNNIADAFDRSLRPRRDSTSEVTTRFMLFHITR